MNIIPVQPNEVVPQDVLQQIAMLLQEGNTMQQAVDIVRLQLVPHGYQPHRFREGIPESYVDKLRSIVATLIYRGTIKDYAATGVDFRTYLYIPEVDRITG